MYGQFLSWNCGTMRVIRPLLSEQNWMQFKREILRICAEHNAKSADRIELLSITVISMFFTGAYTLFMDDIFNPDDISELWRDPLRDSPPHCLGHQCLQILQGFFAVLALGPLWLYTILMAFKCFLGGLLMLLLCRPTSATNLFCGP